MQTLEIDNSDLQTEAVEIPSDDIANPPFSKPELRNARAALKLARLAELPKPKLTAAQVAALPDVADAEVFEFIRELREQGIDAGKSSWEKLARLS